MKVTFPNRPNDPTLHASTGFCTISHCVSQKQEEYKTIKLPKWLGKLIAMEVESAEKRGSTSKLREIQDVLEIDNWDEGRL